MVWTSTSTPVDSRWAALLDLSASAWAGSDQIRIEDVALGCALALAADDGSAPSPPDPHPASRSPAATAAVAVTLRMPSPPSEPPRPHGPLGNHAAPGLRMPRRGGGGSPWAGMSVEPSGCRPAPATSGKPVFLVPLPVGPPLPNDRPTDSATRTGARDGVSERRPSSDSTGWPAWRNWQRTCLVNRGFPVRVRASALYRCRLGGILPCTDSAAQARTCLRICLRSAPRALFRPPPRRTTVRGRTL